MAFTLEDGTGVVDANSYVDVAFADAYFADRGITAWTGTADLKKTWFIQATDYVEGRFGRRFIGTPTNENQGLHFPVNDVDELDEDEIPVKLKRAICEYAIRAKTAPLAPDPTIDASGVAVVTVGKKLGPLEKTFQVVGSGVPALFRPYPAADMLLAGLLIPSSGRVTR